MALLGDSAHAMQPNLGQGGCMAIEDAFQLGVDMAEAMDKVSAHRCALATAVMNIYLDLILKWARPEWAVDVRMRVYSVYALCQHTHAGTGASCNCHLLAAALFFLQ